MDDERTVILQAPKNIEEKIAWIDDDDGDDDGIGVDGEWSKAGGRSSLA
jgi:hypothetical protein